ncbi:syncytin-1-like isoform X1 [Nannospalax galili]|uniref:syncytin-1-like isoform X1 n=1 Tax=Nannospalax galili TaxID=1026970 RepID=UPI00111C62B8|nr:syncytin-1-like isoform X1 [Nannospalax galili]
MWPIIHPSPWWACIFIHLVKNIDGGLQPFNATRFMLTQYGPPCECRGGHWEAPPGTYFRSVDCGDRTAYLGIHGTPTQQHQQSWKCVSKPKPILPPANGECPSDCNFVEAMHSSCYASFTECRFNNILYFYSTAISYKKASGGSDWSLNTQVIGPESYNSKTLSAGCYVEPGQKACWPQQAPIHISDGGGPTDQVKENYVQTVLQKQRESLLPRLHYHPLLLPKPRGLNLDPQTMEILTATHDALNRSNPSLAEDCWLCLALGISWPLVLPLSNESNILPSPDICSYTTPFKVQPRYFNTSICLFSPFQNNSFDVDLGLAMFTTCSRFINTSQTGCLGGGKFMYVEITWPILIYPLTGLDIIPGDEPVPLPSFDTFVPRHKRAVQFIPLLIGLGISGALATGSAGVGVAIDTYNKLSQQLINDVNMVYRSVQDLQDQVDSLAEVVLQNRRGLDLLTADKGGICLALQEKCCFYTNKSGIVRDRIKKHQEELEKRRQELFANPMWGMWNGILPYLLPLVGPLVSLLLILTIGPCIFNRLTQFMRERLSAVQTLVLTSQYQALETSDPDNL